MQMRIVIASGIYPPEIGGPAPYAKGVKESLEKSGHEAPLALFSPFRKYPSGIRHLFYTCKLFRVARTSDAIFAFDTYSVGVPAVFVGKLLGKPVVIRIGGDFMWEQYIERTRELVPLPHFYKKGRKLNFKERVEFSLTRYILRRATLAFNTRWLLDMWQPVYGFDPARAQVIENVIGERMPAQGSDRTILLYGRAIALKNAEALRRAVKDAHTDLVLEEGMLPHEKLLERIRHAHAVAVPSISEVAPNAVIDAIRCGKPFLLTKYSGYAGRFGAYGVVVDPLDENDMARGVRALADPVAYQRLCEKIAQFKDVRTFEEVAREMLALVPKHV
jgi:glycosyltransferase involved in cell wall biosynthesis